MKKITWKGSTLLSPVPPVLVTCGSLEQPNVFTVAWTGIINSQPPKTYISVRPERFSHALIEATGEFVINLTTRALCRAADFCGVRSGADTDKFAECSLHAVPASALGAPMLDESPLSLECRVFETKTLGTHDMFLADIVAVNADETLIDEAGKLHLERCELLAYSHGEYFTLGERLGGFGFSVRKRRHKRK